MLLEELECFQQFRLHVGTIEIIQYHRIRLEDGDGLEHRTRLDVGDVLHTDAERFHTEALHDGSCHRALACTWWTIEHHGARYTSVDALAEVL